jgi:hypothetical protein
MLTLKRIPVANYLNKFADIARQSREYQGHGWVWAFSKQ